MRRTGRDTWKKVQPRAKNFSARRAERRYDALCIRIPVAGSRHAAEQQ